MAKINFDVVKNQDVENVRFDGAAELCTSHSRALFHKCDSYLYAEEHHGILGEELEDVGEREEGDVDVVPRHHHEHEALHGGHEVAVRQHHSLREKGAIIDYSEMVKRLRELALAARESQRRVH